MHFTGFVNLLILLDNKVAVTNSLVWYDCILENDFTLGTLQYCKDNAGVVHLTGSVYRAEAPIANSRITLLPVGFRPKRNIYAPMIQGGSGWTNYVLITAIGNVLVYSGGSEIDANWGANRATMLNSRFQAV
jgi:hypothetical protein